MLRLTLVLPLLLNVCERDETIFGYTDSGAVFVLQEINGRPFAPRASLEFPEPSKISGSGPCNRYSATQSVPLPWFRVENLVANRLACPDLDAETVYFTALLRMSLAEVAGGVLILSSDGGEEMVFQAE